MQMAMAEATIAATTVTQDLEQVIEDTVLVAGSSAMCAPRNGFGACGYCYSEGQDAGQRFRPDWSDMYGRRWRTKPMSSA